MSEKRFAIHRETEEDKVIFSFYDGNKQIDVEDILDLLNNLNDENEQLKKENKRLKRNVKTFEEDRDSNFESAQYFREQLNKIPESIREVWIE